MNVKLEAIGWEEEDAHRRRQLASGLVTALRGQAQKIAEEIGDKALITDDFNGFEELKERLEEYHSPLKQEVVKDLHIMIMKRPTLGSPHVLQRQSSETMRSLLEIRTKFLER